MQFILSLDHIALAPKDVAKATEFFHDILGLNLIGRPEDVVEQKARVTMIDLPRDGVGRIEILEGLGEGSTINDFLAKKGAGIHHLAFKVTDIERLIAYLKARNVTLVSDTPQPGAHNTRVVFVHPKSTGGILVELVEHPPA